MIVHRISSPLRPCSAIFNLKGGWQSWICHHGQWQIWNSPILSHPVFQELTDAIIISMDELLLHLPATHWRKSHLIQASNLGSWQSLLGNVLKMQIHQALLTWVMKHGAYESAFLFFSSDKGVSGVGNGNPLKYSCLENPMNRRPGRLQSIGLHRVGHDRSDLAWAHDKGVARTSPVLWPPFKTHCLRS